MELTNRSAHSLLFLQQPWKSAEVRLFQFDPASVDTDACPLVHVQNIATGGAVAEPTSGDIAAQQGVPAAGAGKDANSAL